MMRHPFPLRGEELLLGHLLRRNSCKLRLMMIMDVAVTIAAIEKTFHQRFGCDVVVDDEPA